jgi:hypothetical protein
MSREYGAHLDLQQYAATVVHRLMCHIHQTI